MYEMPQKDDDLIVLSTFEQVRAALHNRDFSRHVDRTTFAEGNIRDRVLSVLHGNEHRDRRRLENPLFRSDRLTLYERELFPRIVDEVLGRVVVNARAELFFLGRLLSVVLSAKTAGVDLTGDFEELERLAEYVAEFAQATAMPDTLGDKAAVRSRSVVVFNQFQEEFVEASWRRRERLLEEGAADFDLLTVLLEARRRPELRLDDGVIVREVASFLAAGAHTSAQTVINTMLLTVPWADEEVDRWERLRSDRLLVQRCVHEALRLRPTNPGLRRYVEEDAAVGDLRVQRGQQLLLDTFAANTDPAAYSPNPKGFDPDRVLPPGIPRWGLSFGAGPHTCIGRTLTGGLPVPPEFDRPVDEGHLYGLVTLMVEALLRYGARADPEDPPEPDDRTMRWTRWRRCPVVFESSPPRVPLGG